VSWKILKILINYQQGTSKTGDLSRETGCRMHSVGFAHNPNNRYLQSAIYLHGFASHKANARDTSVKILVKNQDFYREYDRMERSVQWPK
jgi:hypothetical protein